MKSNTAIISTAYLPCIQYLCKVISYNSLVIDLYEHFQKQTYRNRCNIYSANGELTLSIPIEKLINPKTIIKDIKISYDTDWQKLHFKAIESAYRSSPFYEFYIDDLMILYSKKYYFLIDLNNDAMNILIDLIKLKPIITFSEKYIESTENEDFRNSIHPKKQHQIIDLKFTPKEYNQVFANKHSFIGNLSIVDVLFNLGPETKWYLQNSINEI